MPVCKNKFWLENYTDLFCEIDIIPLTKMSLARQLNALSRLSIPNYFDNSPVYWTSEYLLFHSGDSFYNNSFLFTKKYGL